MFITSEIIHLFKCIFVCIPEDRISFSKLYAMKMWEKYENSDKLSQASKMYSEIEGHNPSNINSELSINDEQGPNLNKS